MKKNLNNQKSEKQRAIQQKKNALAKEKSEIAQKKLLFKKNIDKSKEYFYERCQKRKDLRNVIVDQMLR